MTLIPLGRKAERDDPLRLGILVSGRGSNMEAIVRACMNGEIPADPRIVLSDRPGVAALERAEELGVRRMALNFLESPSSQEYHDELHRRLNEADVEVVVLAGYMRILPDYFVASFPYRIINIHPSLLPSFPGLNPQQQAIDHGVKLSGATVHLVDAGVDTGPIIVQQAVPVYDEDTPETLARSIQKVEHQLYPKALKLFGSGTLYLSGRRILQRS